MTVATMPLSDKAKQMQGTLYGDAFHTQFNDIQRSQNTTEFRGWRYRDASRGMNLGEDMDGATQNAAVVNGEHVGYSTVFPVSMSRGAAFDLDLEYAIGEAIGDEMQAAKQTLLLAPCMNLFAIRTGAARRRPTARIRSRWAASPRAMTIGVQKHIAANAKHFMAYDIEVSRDDNNSQLDEQTLREIYGRHFRMVVQDGGVSSVMASYNKINGEEGHAERSPPDRRPAHGLRVQGIRAQRLVGDASRMTIAATDANLLKSYAVEAVHAGLDVELPWALCFGQLENIVHTGGGLTEDDITTSAKRVLEQKFRFNADKKTGPVGLGSPITKYRSSRSAATGRTSRSRRRPRSRAWCCSRTTSDTLPINRRR